MLNLLRWVFAEAMPRNDRGFGVVRAFDDANSTRPLGRGYRLMLIDAGP